MSASEPASSSMPRVRTTSPSVAPRKTGPANKLCWRQKRHPTPNRNGRCRRIKIAREPSSEMADVQEFRPGGYRFIKAVFQYSGGVAAMPGYRIRRIRFAWPLPLASGFAQIEQILQTASRPLTAFCQCELRSPAPFTEQGFQAFNEIYAGTPKRWGIL